MSIFDGFKFRRRSTWVHDLDPRVKLALSLIFLVSSVSTFDPVELAIIMIIQLLFIVSSKSFRAWLRSLSQLLFFVLIILISQIIFGSGILSAILYSCRFVIITSTVSWFFLTTSPDDLGRSLEDIGVPRDFSFAFTMSIRFIPVIAEEFNSIFDAQRSRGLELDVKGFRKRVMNFLPILIPVFVETIRRSYEIADSLETKAYGAYPKRTKWKRLKLKMLDKAFIILAALFLFFTVSYRFGFLTWIF
ncbi:MAG: energy-coupling factor transporter transmembrane component T [Thermoproteota archaeon]